MKVICTRRSLLVGSIAAVAAATVPTPHVFSSTFSSNAFDDFTAPDLSNPDFWWSALRETTLVGLGAVPGVGSVLSVFGGLFLPEVTDDAEMQWKNYVGAINKVVEEKIEQALYLQVNAQLKGITDLLRVYQRAMDADNPVHVRSVENSMNVTMTFAMPAFMLTGYQSHLLPLFVPAANVHLALLRQAAQRARRLGESQVADDYARQLQEKIAAYGSYYDRTVAEMLAKEADTHPHDHVRNRSQPWAAVLTLRSNLQYRLGDVRDCWAWFDETRYPDSIDVRLTRALESPLIGSYYDCRQPLPAPLPSLRADSGPVTGVHMGGYAFLDGLELLYAQGKGPGNRSMIKIGSNGGEWVSIDDVEARGHIVAIEALAGNAINRLRLTFGNGSQSPWVGGNGAGQGSPVRVAYPGHRVFNVAGYGTAPGYGGVLSGCVFGFELLNKELKPALDRAVHAHLGAVWPSALQAR